MTASSERDVHGHTQSEPPVEHEEHDDDPADEHGGARRLGDDRAEEVRHPGDVTVDALDEFSRRVRAMELVVETQHVARHGQAQVVGGPPGRNRRQPGDDDREDLRGDGNRQEQQRQAGDLRTRRALGGEIDDLAHDERTGDEQGGADRHERAETHPTPGVGPQQRAERAPSDTARRGLRGHRGISPLRPIASPHISRRAPRTRPRQTGSSVGCGECLRTQEG